jgi:hypothetical protein
VIDEPGQVQVKTVGVDWQANLSGVLNLKDAKAQAAGLKKRKEPIKIYTHVVRHPTEGFFLVDTGVSKRFAQDPKSVGVGPVLRKYAGIQDMHTEPSTAQIIEGEDTSVSAWSAMSSTFSTETRLSALVAQSVAPGGCRPHPVRDEPISSSSGGRGNQHPSLASGTWERMAYCDSREDDITLHPHGNRTFIWQGDARAERRIARGRRMVVTGDGHRARVQARLRLFGVFAGAAVPAA